MSPGGENKQRLIDVAAHLKNANYTRNVFYARIAWAFVAPLLKLVPWKATKTRNAVLRLMGAKIGQGVKIYPSTKICFPWNIEIGDNSLISWDVNLYSLGKIKIGENCIISQGSHLCAGSHDYTKPNLPLTRDPIHIGSETWICAEAFIGPGVTVGRGCVIAARSVVMKDLPDLSIAGGNPARILKKRAAEEVIPGGIS